METYEDLQDSNYCSNKQKLMMAFKDKMQPQFTKEMVQLGKASFPKHQFEALHDIQVDNENGVFDNLLSLLSKINYGAT